MYENALVVAELSANHGQQLEIALRTIEAAAAAGADAIKIQTYTPDSLTLDCNNPYFQVKQGTLWDGRTLYQLYTEAYTPWEWHQPLAERARQVGLQFFSTPFDPTAVDLLETLRVPMYKIASFEITDIPLIKYVASKGKPILISTGIASLGEIAEAVDACRSQGNDNITLLKCTSSYPARPEDANLATIKNLRDTFRVKVGLSDHTMGGAVAVAAVTLGACVVEKHFILDRSMGGPDASFSMEPDEFRKMTEDIRTAEKALGTITYALSPQSQRNRDFARSLFVVADIKAGEVLTTENIRSIRPGFGLSPKHLPDVLGRRARINLSRGTPLRWTDLEVSDLAGGGL